MNNPFERFDRVYCLNLEERTDRWEACLENFKEYGIDNYERFLATKVTKGVYEHENFKRIGQIGCALSFCKMIDDAIEKSYGSVVFLEDDFEFTVPPDIFCKNVTAGFNELPEDWDMFYFGANVIDHFVQKPLSAYSENLLKLNSAYALHSVAISRRGLLKIKEYFKDSLYQSWGLEMISKYEAIDVFFAQEFQRNNQCFISKEMLALQRPDFSTIENLFMSYGDLLNQRFDYFKSLIC